MVHIRRIQLEYDQLNPPSSWFFSFSVFLAEQPLSLHGGAPSCFSRLFSPEQGLYYCLVVAQKGRQFHLLFYKQEDTQAI
jgi:hypothetical protein